MRKLTALVTLLCLVAVPAMAAKTIRIGVMAPMTGNWASEGQEMKQIVELLAAEINATGGVNGQQVEAVMEDDGGDPRTAALAATRLTTKDVIAVVGNYGSSITEAAQMILDEAPLVQIANGSTAVRLTEKGLKYFLRTSPRDDEQGRVAAQTLKAQGFKKVAVLHDNTSYAKGLADETMGLLKGLGIDVVFADALTPGERDYSAILTKMKGKNPDAVFFTGYYPEAGLLLKQKAQVGWTVPFIGGDATNNPDLVKIAGKEAAAGFYFLSPPVPQDLPYAKAKKFVADYSAKYGSAPGSIWAVLSGDGFLSIVDAVKATGSTDTEKIAAYLKTEGTKVDGLTGPIAFNAKGDRVGEVYQVYKVNADGQFVLQP